MCSSRPKIPNAKTPPAPNAPEPAPDAPLISDRAQYARSQGLKVDPRPDLSGMGNQDVGAAVSRLIIRPGSSTPIDPVVEDAAGKKERERIAAQHAHTAQMTAMQRPNIRISRPSKPAARPTIGRNPR